MVRGGDRSRQDVMRIIAGRLGGQQFDSPGGHRTHPMSDKVRGAIFNMLGDIDGLTVLDAFAGSGALAFEAVSRGASVALAIDSDKNAKATMDRNVRKLQLSDQIKVIQANASGWSDNNPQQRFDVVLCDPPYDHTQLSLLQKITAHLKPHGILVLSWPGKSEAPMLEPLSIIARKQYGDAQLIFYRASDLLVA
jgi:16S rRNA (guanine966-N2)-methyltransferase